MSLRIAFCFLIAFSMAQTSGAQTLSDSARGAATQPTAKPDKISDEHVYGLFFRRITRISELGNETPNDPMSNEYPRLYLQKQLHITAAQADEVNKIALQLKSDLTQEEADAKKLRAKRHVLVQTRRAQNLPSPPISPEIKAIPTKRAGLILAARDQLKQILGTETFGRLDAKLKTQNKKAARPASAASSEDRSDVSQEGGPAVKTRIVYRALFREVVGFQLQADKERNLGLPKAADSLRTEVQRLAALTDEQVRILDEIATSYSAKLIPYVQQYRDLRRQYDQRRFALFAMGGTLSGSKELADARDAMKQVHEKIDELTDGSIQQLRKGFGEDAFGRFDAFVRQPIKRLPPRPSKSDVTTAASRAEVGR